MKKWNVMLIDHDRLFSAALGTLINGGPFRIGIIAISLSEADAALNRQPSPDVIIVATALVPDEDALTHLRDRSGARIVLLGSGDTTASLIQALRAGADAYLDKGMSRESLWRALHLVVLGEVVYPLGVADLLTPAMAEPPAAAPPAIENGGTLSRREVQILRCLLAGQSNKTIARHLCITESTVKMHFKNVMRKIQAQNRTQAAVWAIQNGLSPSAGAS